MFWVHARFVRDSPAWPTGASATSGILGEGTTKPLPDLNVVTQPLEFLGRGLNTRVAELAFKKAPIRSFHLLVCRPTDRPVRTDHHLGGAFDILLALSSDRSAADPPTVVKEQRPFAGDEDRIQMSPRRRPVGAPIIEIDQGE